MEQSRLVRFVGGPLHGESREVPAGRDEFQISREAAFALKGELEGGEMPEGLDPEELLVYSQRKDGRYYLRIERPEEVPYPPDGFFYLFFDCGGEEVIAELHGPSSAWGSPRGEFQVSREVLANPHDSEDGKLVFRRTIRMVEDQEAKIARGQLTGRAIMDLAMALRRGEELDLASRRLAAAALRVFAHGGMRRQTGTLPKLTHGRRRRWPQSWM